MAARLRTDPARTNGRVTRLRQYFVGNVFEGERFTCKHAQDCIRKTRGVEYIKGQSHYVGAHYDLFVDEAPFRIVVVGQEYGHEGEFVTLQRRAEMLRFAAYKRRRRGVPDSTGPAGTRNQHTTGTTSVLRVLMELPLEGDWKSEMVAVTGHAEPVHIFEMFGLVNYLLCSRVRPPSKRGKATARMKRNCEEHFRRALDILEPTLIVVQGKGYWQHMKGAFNPVVRLEGELYRVALDSAEVITAVFSHPSAGGKMGWGNGIRQKYLQEVVVPVAKKAREMVLAQRSEGRSVGSS